MATNLVLSIKIPLPEGSMFDQAPVLAEMKSAMDVFRSALPTGTEFTDKIVKSSGAPRKPRTPKTPPVAQAA